MKELRDCVVSDLFFSPISSLYYYTFEGTALSVLQLDWNLTYWLKGLDREFLPIWSPLLVGSFMLNID